MAYTPKEEAEFKRFRDMADAIAQRHGDEGFDPVPNYRELLMERAEKRGISLTQVIDEFLLNFEDSMAIDYLASDKPTTN